MNTTFKYIFFLLAVLITSCEKESDEKPEDSFNIVIPEGHDIDINNDNIMDFRVDYKLADTFNYPSSKNSWIGYIQPLNDNEIVYNTTIKSYLLQKNDTISLLPEKMIWLSDKVDLMINDGKNLNWEVLPAKLTDEYYLGIKLKTSTETSIGWLKLAMFTNSGVISLTDTLLRKANYIAAGSKNKLVVKEFLIINPLSTKDEITGLVDKSIYVDAFSPGTKVLTLDLNNDAKDDITFSCGSSHTLGGINTSYAAIYTLNENTAIDIKQVVETFASWSTKIIYNGSELTLSDKVNYDNTKQYPTDVQITNKSYNYPVIHSIGDSLQGTNDWMTGSFTLESYYSQEGFMHENWSLGIWGNNIEKYIAVRIKQERSYYYGWIELDVEGYKIHVHKFAMKEFINNPY